jgi:Amino acid synthesis
VRDNYDALEVRVPDAPLPDELVVVAVVANRGRLLARCGGLTADKIEGNDGLR